MVDMSFNTLQAALGRALGGQGRPLHRERAGQLVVGHNLQLRPVGLDPEKQVAGLDVIWEGSHLRHPLTNIGWDLNLLSAPCPLP